MLLELGYYGYWTSLELKGLRTMQYIFLLSKKARMSKINGAVHLVLPSQPAGVHVNRALNVLVSSQQTQHNEPTLASHSEGPVISIFYHDRLIVILPMFFLACILN